MSKKDEEERIEMLARVAELSYEVYWLRQQLARTQQLNLLLLEETNNLREKYGKGITELVQKGEE